MKSSPLIAALFAIATCKPDVVPATTTPCAPQDGDLHAATRSIRGSLNLLVQGLEDVGVDHVALRKLNSKAAEGYAPWDLADEEEGIANNPLYEESQASSNPLYGALDLLASAGADVTWLGSGATAKERAERRDRAAAWQGWFASIAATPQDAPEWQAPGVRAGLATVQLDFAGARCVLATLATGSDEDTAACVAGADLLSAVHLLSAQSALVDRMTADEADRKAVLTTLREPAQAYAEAVHTYLGEGDAADQADALVDAIDAAIDDVESPELAALKSVLDAEVAPLDALMVDVRVALRDATARGAAHEAAHVVQQRSGSLDQVFAHDGGLPACAGEGLECLMSLVTKRVRHADIIMSLQIAAEEAFPAAADKAPVPERKAALRAALQAAAATREATGESSWTRPFASISNVLKTKHDTAKNSVSNIR
jgi:hypothetical protein